MEKKSANELLRKIIREELTKVIREELPKLLSESVQPIKQQVKKTDQPLLTLNSSPMVRYEDVKFKKSNNPLTNLLNETAMSMRDEDPMISFSSEDVGPGIHPALAFQPKEVAVGSPSDMLATARASSNIDAVQINVVPDYSAMMEKMGL